MLSRDVICNLTLAAIIVVLLVRRYLQYAESQAVAEAPQQAALEEAAAPRRAIPTPTAIPGPAVMRSILGKCKHFKGGNAVEFCGFRSVKQITGAGSHYMGFWGKVRWAPRSPLDAGTLWARWKEPTEPVYDAPHAHPPALIL